MGDNARLRNNSPESGGSTSKRWIWVLLILLAGAVALVVLSLFNRDGIQGNSGVIALYDFVRSYQKREIQARDEILQVISRRLKNEPFEITTDITLTADGMVAAGMPFSTIIAGVDVKYDINDFGIKADVMGFPIAAFYITEDKLITDAGGEIKTFDLTKSESKSAAAIDNRDKTLLPKFFTDDASMQRVFRAAAQSVPENCSQTKTINVYSPMHKQLLEMGAVYTRMNTFDIKAAAAAFAARLKDDAALCADMQEVYEAARHLFGSEETDVYSFFEKLAHNVDETAVLEFAVYINDGQYAGYSFSLENDSSSISFFLMAENDDSSEYGYISVHADGQTVFETKYGINYREKTLFGSVITKNFSLSFTGVYKTEQYTHQRYAIIGDLTVSGSIPGIEFSDSVCALRTNLSFGKDLEKLKDSSGWSDIYKKTWKEMCPGE